MSQNIFAIPLSLFSDSIFGDNLFVSKFVANEIWWRKFSISDEYFCRQKFFFFVVRGKRKSNEKMKKFDMGNLMKNSFFFYFSYRREFVVRNINIIPVLTIPLFFVKPLYLHLKLRVSISYTFQNVFSLLMLCIND